MRSLLLASLMLTVAACHKPADQQASQTNSAAEAGPAKGVDRSHHGKPGPDVTFKDPDGGDILLDEFKGVPVLVNLWATWCAPCVKELPTLDRLSQAQDKDGKLGIVAISQDMGPHPSVVAFLDGHNIKSLGAYQDSKMGLSAALGAEVLPTSILFDANGNEVWRYVGDLDWSGPEAAKLLAEAGNPAKR